MTGAGEYVIRDIEAKDAEPWTRLYNSYRQFYNLPADDAAVATTWEWMLARQHGLRGIVAEGSDGEIVALANLRTFARPSVAKVGLYLDDLFTAPSARGSGAASSLLDRAAEIAAEDGANVIRWITASDNTKARSVYDSHAVATPWVTYDMKPALAKHTS